MLIDWFTVVAQAINFLLLVWLLKRFLYKPILQAIDDREKRIANQLQEAGATKEDAEKERRDFQKKNAEFDQQRDALFSQATAKAQDEGRQQLDKARKEYKTLRAKLQESLREEQHSLSREITDRARQEVFAISRKVLADLADATLEEQIAAVFIRRLLELEGKERKKLVEAFNSAGRPAIVRSAFPLSAAQQAAIGKALKDTLVPKAKVQFETNPEQLSGIELSMNGYKIAWSITDYLASLEKSIAVLLNGKPKAEAEPKTKAGPNQDTDEKND